MEMERPVRRDDDSLSQDGHGQGGEKWPDSRALGPCPAVPWAAQDCGAAALWGRPGARSGLAAAHQTSGYRW